MGTRPSKPLTERNDDVTDTLSEGQKLEKGQSITSANGAYTLTLHDDGNLVLAARGQAVWATGTNGQDVVRAEVQTDGNFVLYTPDQPVWASDTLGKNLRVNAEPCSNSHVSPPNGILDHARSEDAWGPATPSTSERQLH